jgi:hypothetical protein
MFIDCETCTGKGKTIETGFDGKDGRQCGTCHGAGEIELTREEEAIMLAFLADCAASLDGAATVADVERFVNTPLPLPAHPNMTARFFDAAVKRVHDAGLSISRTGTPDVVAVSSGTDDDTYYTVSRDTCTCIGGTKLGRCYHRAYALYYWWLMECDAVAAAATPEPIAA